MITFNRVLLATDFCKSEGPALHHAVALARKYQAELYVQHVVPDYFDRFPHWTTLFDMRPLQEKRHGRATGEMSSLITRLSKTGLEIKPILRKGHPANEIVRFARENAIDLIIMATHAQERKEAGVLGTVPESVLRETMCPVLTVPPSFQDPIDASEVTTPMTLRRILLPTDFSKCSHHALEYARSLSEEYHARLLLLSVVEFAEAIRFMDERDHMAHHVQAILHWAEVQLDKALPDAIKKRTNWEKRVVEGEPYREILKMAQETNVDLIVLGAHGWSPLRKFFLGTTAEKIVRNAPCPVLTVKF